MRTYFVTRRKNFVKRYTLRYPLLYAILAGQSTSGELGGREVKTCTLVSRTRSCVRIPPEWFIFRDNRKAQSVSYIASVQGKTNKIGCLSLDARILSICAFILMKTIAKCDLTKVKHHENGLSAVGALGGGGGMSILKHLVSCSLKRGAIFHNFEWGGGDMPYCASPIITSLVAGLGVPWV